jgi:hypothetical protein
VQIIEAAVIYLDTKKLSIIYQDEKGKAGEKGVKTERKCDRGAAESASRVLDP